MLYTITHAMSFFDRMKAFVSRTPSAIVFIEPLTDHEETLLKQTGFSLEKPDTPQEMLNELSEFLRNPHQQDVKALPATWAVLNPYIRITILSSETFRTNGVAASNEHILKIAALLKKPMSDPYEIVGAMTTIRDALEICIGGGIMGGSRRLKRIPKRIPKGRLA